ncbi:hypothetical protein RFI_28521 [Reticulomyxa filosa]|uniref:Uncharacterized protein n=1 Tax=Reticulomyxa filosa TaxID=46433 RepID=X6M601_RETFI|nr:hypothetical protein RFI_28521 [Reticulomyxa filosa]|eukprot:ETO08867.1 hypothetical protein RFI_28521 [Reticulomyxa filosa]
MYRKEKTAEQLCQQVFALCCQSLAPTYVKITSGMLSLGLRLGYSCTKLVSHFIDDTPVCLTDEAPLNEKKEKKELDEELLDLGQTDFVCTFCCLFPKNILTQQKKKKLLSVLKR